MKALLQRVTQASVTVEDRIVGEIGPGLLVFAGIERADDEQQVARVARRIVDYRMFADDTGRMNLSVRQSGGSILAVSQFTLAADTRRGLRPGFSEGAEPVRAQALYNHLVDCLVREGVTIATGIFGADMKVCLVNDGPVTFMLS